MYRNNLDPFPLGYEHDVKMKEWAIVRKWLEVTFDKKEVTAVGSVKKQKEDITLTILLYYFSVYEFRVVLFESFKVFR